MPVSAVAEFAAVEHQKSFVVEGSFARAPAAALNEIAAFFEGNIC